MGYSTDERAFADDLPFTTPTGVDDLAGVTLLVAVREVDLRGRGPVDVEQLTQLHGDPSVQDEHCLRTSGQDGEKGSSDAVDACRAFIKNRLLAALDGLDSRGVPDASRRGRIRLTLAIRGSVEIDLPIFYLRMGEALHATQDSFTHAYRTPSGREVTVVLNWVEHVDDRLVESRDGPPHLGALDECDDSDQIRTYRRAWATSASTDLLRTAVDSSLDRAAKSAAFDRTLDQWLTFRAGCTEANRWCDAPEHALQDTGCGCSAIGRRSYGGLALLIGLAVLLLRRRSLALIALTVMAPATTRADDAGSPATPNKPAFEPCPCVGDAGVGEGIVGKGTKEVLGDPTRDFGMHFGFGLSLDQPALAGSIGARYRLTDKWLVGINAEWNPWAAVFGRFRTGAFNGYGSLIKRWSMRSDTYALRSTLHLGTSTLLMNLYGAPRWTTGLFVGVSFIGLEVKLSRGMTMIFSPAEIAVPAPQLRGLFVYPQYRFTISLQWGAAG